MKFLLFLYFFTISINGISAPNDDFVITVQTDASGTTDPTRFYIPLTASINYNVDCNNDGVDEVIAQLGGYICEYSGLGGVGTYTIRIKDNTKNGNGYTFFNMSSSLNSNSNKLVSLDQWGTSHWTSMHGAFNGCSNMVVLATDVPNLSLVKDMSWMFNNAYLADPNVSNWDVSSVTNMDRMFSETEVANPDVSQWDVASVKSMGSMFHRTKLADPNVSNWDVSSVTNMHGMFSETENATPDVSRWDVSSVTNMQSLFSGAKIADPDVGTWDVSSVINMGNSFSHTFNANPDVSDWDVSSVTNMGGMFREARLANPDVSAWDVSSVENMNQMFYMAELINPDVSKWDVSSVIHMEYMFYKAVSANPDVSKWDVSSVTDMGRMFWGSGLENTDLSNWNVSSVLNMRNMFTGAHLAIPNVSNWDVSSVTNMERMFAGAILSNPNVGNWDVSSVKIMSGMFQSAAKANPDVSNWDVSSVIDMSWMFNNTLLADPDVSNWDVSSVTNMYGIFYNTEVANPNVNHWDVASVIDMGSMFNRAKLADPNVSNWDVSSVTNMSSMFYNAEVANPHVTQWDVSSVTGMGSMFTGITLPTHIYDAMLINWGNQKLQSDVFFSAGNSRYCNTITRDYIVDTFGWIMRDSGPDECLNEQILQPVITLANTYFGIDVSMENNRALIGAKGDNENGVSTGAAYIIEKTPDGWMQSAKLKANDGIENDAFGGSVSLSGDTALIGAAFHENDIKKTLGAAYVFKYDGIGWTQAAKLTPNDSFSDNKFGESVSLSGKRALVSAVGDNNFNGAVYVFDRIDEIWEQSDKLTSSEPNDDFFGKSISLYGNRALIGVNSDSTNTGAVYVYELIDSNWVETVKLVANNGLIEDKFGYSVSLNNNRALIGAKGTENLNEGCPGSVSFGSAYIFDLNDKIWTQSAQIFDNGSCDYDSFGVSVKLDGNHVLIGADGASDNGIASGAAFIFELKNNIWSKKEKILASDGSANDGFGLAVGLSNRQVLIGAPSKNNNKGALYSYDTDTIFTNGFE